MITEILLGFFLTISYQPFLCDGIFFAVSATSASFCSPACPLLIVIYFPVVWASAAVGWASGAVVAGSSIRVSIADCVSSNAFITFTQDNAISWDVDELSSTIFFSMNGGTVT